MLLCFYTYLFRQTGETEQQSAISLNCWIEKMECHLTLPV